VQKLFLRNLQKTRPKSFFVNVVNLLAKICYIFKGIECFLVVAGLKTWGLVYLNSHVTSDSMLSQSKSEEIFRTVKFLVSTISNGRFKLRLYVLLSGFSSTK